MITAKQHKDEFAADSEVVSTTFFKSLSIIIGHSLMKGANQDGR
jgi:hypothetical protein